MHELTSHQLGNPLLPNHVGSLGGGVTIVVPGQGFAPFATGSTTVTVCGFACNITAASYRSIACTTPPIVTPELLTALPTASPLRLLTGTPYGTGSTQVNYAAAFDGSIETTSQAGSTTCSTGLDLGVAVVGNLQRIR